MREARKAWSMCVFDWKVEVQHWTGNTFKKKKQKKNKKQKTKNPIREKRRKRFGWLIANKN